MVESTVRYEKYYDPNYECAYYYDKESGESIWELPEGVDEAKQVIDMTGEKEAEAEGDEQPDTKQAKAAGSEEDKDHKELQQYKAHMSSVDQMQREALAMLYPDALTNLDKIQA